MDVSGWTERDVCVGGEYLLAFSQEYSTLTDLETVLCPNLQGVINEGGSLFWHSEDFVPGSVRIADEAADGSPMYATDSTPEYELWYLPRCSFDQWLQVPAALGFLKGMPATKAQRADQFVKELIQTMAQLRRVAVTGITSCVLIVRIVDPEGLPFSREEVDAVFSLNERELSVSYEQSERRDLRSNYIEKRFVVLGPAPEPPYPPEAFAVS